MDNRDKDVIALTHVCRAWRDVFTSRPCLWTHLDLDDTNRTNEDKARVYLERSKSSPISLSLYRENPMFPSDPFFRIIPHAVGRIRFLSIDGVPENLQDITAHLTSPTPLLEHFSITGDCLHLSRHPVLTSALFNGDLSSLRDLSLDYVRTELPWRNMVNLTSFVLAHMPPGEVSVRQLLDFFESAPHLREVDLYSSTPTSGAQDGRLVSLTCLKRMQISRCGPPPALLDHLLVPVGAELILGADLLSSLIGDLLPRSLNNLRNLPNFTTIKLYMDGFLPHVILSGPNGRVTLTPTTFRVGVTDLMLESLAQLDTSRTKRFKIGNGNPVSEDIYRILLPMKDLRALMLYECCSPHIFVRTLHPSTSSSEAVVCPELEELVFVPCGGGGAFDLEDVIGMAEARASRGRKLKAVRIIDRGGKFDLVDVLELRTHVEHVEHTHQTCEIGDEWR